MCLGVPGRVVAIDGPVATVDFWGVRREVRLDVVDEPVAIGDYVLNHVGYAIRRIPEREIGETLALYELLLREAEREDGGPSGPWPEDAMAADVRGEIAAAAPSRGSRRGG
jgi:hydrogenase expression/formation protein HypC